VEAYAAAVRSTGSALLNVLLALEQAGRHMEAATIPKLRELIAPRAETLVIALEELRKQEVPDGMDEFSVQFRTAAERAAEAATLFSETPGEGEGIARMLASMRAHCQAQDLLYPLRRVLRPVGQYFAESEVRDHLDGLEPDANPEPVGVFHVGPAEVGEGGGFSLYVPEWYSPERSWPLVVALHGGHGRGRDFLWTWLREARSRGALLLAPTSQGPTWSFLGADVDAPRLRSLIETVAERWTLDRDRILLTGLSDGATYTLFCGLREDSPFTALAPCSGVLHPTLLAEGRMDAARGRRIYLVHGARDWMFPVGLAQAAHEALQDAGAEIVYREIPDLAHAYAREENPRILQWFDASLVPRSD